MNLQYHELARGEVLAIVEYYASIQTELAADFLTELAVGIDAILATPTLFEQVRSGIHRYILERFPYGIYYRILNGESVRIIIVRHHSRHPNLGMRRK